MCVYPLVIKATSAGDIRKRAEEFNAQRSHLDNYGMLARNRSNRTLSRQSTLNFGTKRARNKQHDSRRSVTRFLSEFSVPRSAERTNGGGARGAQQRCAVLGCW
eukprot:COSAG02_NODE_40724_length_402_cov_0.808581_1_plen_103_part_10